MQGVIEGSLVSIDNRFEGSFAKFDKASGLIGGAALPDGTNLLTAKRVNSIFEYDLAAVVKRSNEIFGNSADTANFVTADVMGDCGTAYCPSTRYDLGTDRQTTETTESAYLQYKYVQDIFKANIGLRYEKTDVESIGNNKVYTGTNWGSKDEVSLTGNQATYIKLDGSYSRFLPSIDLSFNASDDVVLRASASKSIARPSYGNIAASVNVGSPFQRQMTAAEGGVGNPNLLPFESLNLDLAAEWYYGESSYASFGVFSKQVSNFISEEIKTVQGSYAPGAPELHNPIGGVYYQQAVTALGSTDPDMIRNWIFTHLDGQPGVNAAAGSILGQPNDPLVNFNMKQSNNAGDDRKILGYEFAVQHMFGETGFGTQFNATATLSDLSWNDKDANANQARPLIGVSDSANLIGFYDKNGWNVRIAYNWRDKFLSSYDDWKGPQYVKSYYQVDVGASYEVTEHLKVSLDGINVTSNPYVIVARDDLQVRNYYETGARWMLGASYSF
jgi:TonB-dependent receptor